MAVQTSPGTDNLRADPSVKSAAPNASPAGKGKDAGGTANLNANAQVKSNPGKSAPAGGARNSWPAGVQSFTEGSV